MMATTNSLKIYKLGVGHFENQKELDKHFMGHALNSGQNYSLKCENSEKRFKKQKQLNVHFWRPWDLKKHEQKDYVEFDLSERFYPERPPKYTFKVAQKSGSL